jgi:hypothetical protein
MVSTGFSLAARRLGSCAFAWLGLGLVARAQPTPTSILFVGDSFTHGRYTPVRTYNSPNVTDENYGLPPTNPRYESVPSETGPWGGIPGIFKKMTDEAGLSYDVHIEAVSAHSLHFQYDSALAVVAQSKWNKVVLQDLSTYPLPSSRGGKRSTFYSAATGLEQAIHAANAQAQVYLYETWGRADLTYPAGKPYSGLPIDSMTQDLHNGYYRQFFNNGHYAGVAPVGDAFLRAIATGVAMRNPYAPDNTKLALWNAKDNYHPSPWGAYLSACVLFARITGVDPRTLGAAEQAAADLGIAPAAAVALQQVAYDQVNVVVMPPVATITAFTPGNFVAVRVGDGSATLTSAAAPVFLAEYTPAGTLVQTLPLPTVDAGANFSFTNSGTAGSDDNLTRSADGRYLVLTGYDATPGTASVTGTTAAATNRLIGRVGADGTYDTSTRISDAFSGTNFRSAASADGTTFYAAGGNSGIRYLPLGNAGPTTALSTGAVTNFRAVNIFGGNLYVSSAANPNYGVNQIGTGLPTAAGAAVALLPGFPTASGPSPYGIFFADLSTTVPGLDVVYVADDNPSGGIQKWSLVGGTWKLNGTIGGSTTALLRGLAGTASGSGVRLVASGGGGLYTVSDNAGYNAAPTTITLPAPLVTPSANTAFRGIALAPVAPPTTWLGTASTDWFAAGNWSAGVPTSATDVIISSGAPNYPVLSTGTATTRALTLAGGTLTQTGGTLDVRGNWTNNGTFGATGGAVSLGQMALATLAGSSNSRFYDLVVNANGVQLGTAATTQVQRVLTLAGSLATQGNPLTLLSASTGDALVVNSGGVVVGNATVQRFIDPSINSGAGYRHYAAPVSNTTVADLATSGFAPVLTQSYNTSATPGTTRPFPTVFAYDQSRLSTAANNLSAFDKGFVVPAGPGTPLAVGQGYAVQIGASQLVDFVGTLTTDDQTVGLARNADATAPDAGWALVGNPYPSPLDYALVAAADRPNLDAAMYVVQSSGPYAGQYRAFVNGLPAGGGLLASGQGFFVRVSAGQTSGSLTFRNAQRLTTPAAATFQRATADQRPLVALALRSSTGQADLFYAYAEAGATAATDAAYDAAKLPNATGLNLASLASDQGRLAIDGRAAFTPATSLALTVGVPAAGSYSLSAPTLANLPAGLDAYLRDAQTNQTIKLSPGTSYAFAVTAAEAGTLLAGRFTLQFSPALALAASPGLPAASVSVYPNPAHGSFMVQLPGVANAPSVQAELLNVLGQVVRRQSASLPAGGTTLLLPAAGLPPGVYTLRLQAGAASLVKRVVIQ